MRTLYIDIYNFRGQLSMRIKSPSSRLESRELSVENFTTFIKFVRKNLCYIYIFFFFEEFTFCSVLIGYQIIIIIILLNKRKNFDFKNYLSSSNFLLPTHTGGILR